ncbi:hypothetical protein THASP1DRAFT_31179 [Thamnocephalis sphaerospora]|uniref:RING-type domain-containing protein n=1 Tax=Thamnocephalis sphaerospora TaxID=78915 RepID=A0A4P9XP32_9FUNG|nr:hypothetical protein THASP1DRAFT_31179 [Thamnocephalis sphaerospora]|eukprot:RKP07010.1 hypothetical protein THASP1DRAFT_31179 [Thamnocephalis sphaerospora]
MSTVSACLSMNEQAKEAGAKEEQSVADAALAYAHSLLLEERAARQQRDLKPIRQEMSLRAAKLLNRRSDPPTLAAAVPAPSTGDGVSDVGRGRGVAPPSDGVVIDLTLSDDETAPSRPTQPVLVVSDDDDVGEARGARTRRVSREILDVDAYEPRPQAIDVEQVRIADPRRLYAQEIMPARSNAMLWRDAEYAQQRGAASRRPHLRRRPGASMVTLPGAYPLLLDRAQDYNGYWPLMPVRMTMEQQHMLNGASGAFMSEEAWRTPPWSATATPVTLHQPHGPFEMPWPITNLGAMERRTNTSRSRTSARRSSKAYVPLAPVREGYTRDIFSESEICKGQRDMFQPSEDDQQIDQVSAEDKGKQPALGLETAAASEHSEITGSSCDDKSLTFIDEDEDEDDNDDDDNDDDEDEAGPYVCARCNSALALYAPGEASTVPVMALTTSDKVQSDDDDQQSLFANKCGHVFCGDCKPELTRSRRCPVCRTLVTARSLRRLYLA